MEKLFNTTYLVIGFKDKNKMATYNEEYPTEELAREFIEQAIKEKRFESITLRREQRWIGNNDNTDISISIPIEHFDL